MENEKGTFTDSRDGKVYKTIKIGNQIWMAENLAFNAEKDCWIYKYDDNNLSKYGYLYTWETAKKVNPLGWHLPTDEEWQQLEMYLGMSKSDASSINWRGAIAAKLKNTSGWNTNTGTNESGFNAVPGGIRDHLFDLEGINAGFWTSTQEDDVYAYGRLLDEYNSQVYRNCWSKNYGYSVRCVMD